ncbi:MAG TPA: hypothetical protein VM013_03965 [Dehalococcoidia bacterium]|nr:hypothetical protein [Dehalococcoidia bacterium]
MLKSIQKLQSRDLLASLESIKLKPSTMLLALGGILLVAHLVVTASYVMERREQSGLRQQTQAGSGTLSAIGDSQQTLKGLEDRLFLVNAGLQNLEHAFPTKLDSTAIVQSLLDHANQSHVRIKQMSTLPASQVVAQKDENGEEVSYAVLKYTLVIDGDLAEVLSFLSLIEDGTAQTAALGDVSVAEATGTKEMVLNVTFYAQPETAGTDAAGTAPGAAPAPPANQSESDQG